ncbi:MAG: hypothetical protein ACRC0L_09000 [Angustibacter sp.]
MGDIVNALNPEAIVLGGILARIFGIFPQEVRSALTEASLNAPREQVTLLTSTLAAPAVLIGAGERAFAPLLEDPARVLNSPPEVIDLTEMELHRGAPPGYPLVP